MSQMAGEQGNQGQESGSQQQAGSGTQGQESGTGAGQGQESGQQQGQQQEQGGGQGFDLSTITDPAVRAYVEQQQRDAAEARRQAATYRTDRNTLQQQVQQFQQANETEQQRIQREAQEAQQRLETLEAENRALRVGTALQAAATQASAFNPALVASMLDAKVTLDDKGQPTNVQDLLKDLRQSDPYLFKRTPADGGEGNGSENQPSGNMNDVIRGAVAARRGRTS